MTYVDSMLTWPRVVWELDAGKYDSSPVFPAFTPFTRIKHNCQTVSSELVLVCDFKA